VFKFQLFSTYYANFIVDKYGKKSPFLENSFHNFEFFEICANKKPSEKGEPFLKALIEFLWQSDPCYSLTKNV